MHYIDVQKWQVGYMVFETDAPAQKFTNLEALHSYLGQRQARRFFGREGESSVEGTYLVATPFVVNLAVK